MITYSTAEAGTPAFSSAPAMAIAPRSLPEKSFSEPISLPTGVRAPATITDVVISYLRSRVAVDDQWCGRRIDDVLRFDPGRQFCQNESSLWVDVDDGQVCDDRLTTPRPVNGSVHSSTSLD